MIRITIAVNHLIYLLKMAQCWSNQSWSKSAGPVGSLEYMDSYFSAALLIPKWRAIWIQHESYVLQWGENIELWNAVINCIVLLYYFEDPAFKWPGYSNASYQLTKVLSLAKRSVNTFLFWQHSSGTNCRQTSFVLTLLSIPIRLSPVFTS